MPMTYEFYLDIKLSRYIHVRTTSWSSIRYIYVRTISWSLHHHGTRLQQAQRPNVGLEQSTLEARKEDYFKINASPGIRWWWLDRREVPSIATTRA